MTKKYGESLADQLEVEYESWVLEYPETAWSRLLHRACKRLRLYEAALSKVAKSRDYPVNMIDGGGGVCIDAGIKDMAQAVLEKGEADDRIGK